MIGGLKPSLTRAFYNNKLNLASHSSGPLVAVAELEVRQKKDKMKKAEIAERFLKHDFHDMLLKEINFRSASDRRGKPAVTVVLLHWDKTELIHINFKQLANVS
ncbi:MAG: hypothetical protein KAX16_06675, partial [Actinomycetia bacterium]|nr:hypothetical protein [Actinomycetes bacterium]